MPDVKVKFVCDHTVNNAEEPQSFKEGKTYTMNEASAAHFTRRGLAETVEGKTKPAPPPKPPGK